MPKFMRAPAVRARQRGFLDFSVMELAIISGVALVVLGPKKLPPLVQQIGRLVGRARHMARQFREQLEQEVNSINEVKPVSRPAAPDVDPAAPGTEASGVVDTGTADVSGDASARAEVDANAQATTDAEASTSAESGAGEEAPPGSDVHPETQIYFALNGTEPAVVAQNPYAPPAAAADPQASPEQPSAVAGAPAAESGESATVAVVFPHDHDHG